MESYIRLMVISETVSPEQIRSQLGIAGDEIWRIGDKRKNTAIVEKDNGWMIHSKKEESTNLDSHLDDIKKAISGYESYFKIASSTFDCEVQLSCIIYGKDRPSLLFEKGTIHWLSSIGASLDIDLYII